MASKDRQQLYLAVEQQPGLLAPNYRNIANAKIEIAEPRFRETPRKFERDIIRGTLSPDAPLIGLLEAELTFRFELSGSKIDLGSSVFQKSTPPPWAPLFDAAGARRYGGGTAAGADELRKVALSGLAAGAKGITGFQGLEDITAPGKDTGFAFQDHLSGDTFLALFRPNAGAPIASADVITGAITGATATVGQGITSSGGIGWVPWDDHEEALCYLSNATAVDANVDDILIGQDSRAVIQLLEGWAGTAPGPADTKKGRIRLLHGTISGTDASPETFVNQTTAGADLTAEIDQANEAMEMIVPTLTLALVEDGVLKTMRGARVNISVTKNAGEPGIATVTATGLLVKQEVGTAFALPGVVFESQTPPIFQDGDLRISPNEGDAQGDEHTPYIQSLTWDLGNEVELREDPTSAEGGIHAVITSRNPTVSINPEALPEAVHPWVGRFLDNKPNRVRWRIGKEDQNMFTFIAPSAFVDDEQTGDRGNRLTRELSMVCGIFDFESTPQPRRDWAFIYWYETFNADPNTHLFDW